MLKIKSINPIVPKNAADPANQFGNLKRAKSELNKRYSAIYRELRDFIYKMPRLKVNSVKTWRQPTKQEVEIRTNEKGVKCMFAANVGVLQINTYVYELDARAAYTFIDSLLDTYLLDNENQYSLNRWWLLSNLDSAYEDAVTDVVTDSVSISPPEVVGADLYARLQQLTPESQMFSQPVLRRLSLMHSRVFNEMKGLTESSKSDLGRVLTQGMIDGNGVQEIAKQVRERVNVSMSRAMRIVRTEILNSYRTATRTEIDDLNENVYADSDWEQQMLWFSALASTTRPWHSSRHGLVYTSKEVKDFYAERGNSISCLCSQSPILVNKKTGEVLQSSLLKRMKEQKEAWKVGVMRSI